MFKKINLLFGTLIFTFICSMFCLSNAGYVQTYKIDYSSTTERSDVILKGDFYVSESTNTADADAIIQSGTNNPITLYNGDLKVNTTSYGIRFADGSKQITAGVGSATDVLSSTGTVVISADTDASGNENIYFQTLGATNRMIIDGATGYVGINTTDPDTYLHVQSSVTAILYPVLGTTDNSSALFSNAAGLYGMLIGTSGTGDNWLQSQRTDASTDTYSILLNPLGGNVAIGTTTTPTEKLDVNGNIALEGNKIFDYDASNFELDISTDIKIVDVKLSYDETNYELDISTDVNIVNAKLSYDEVNYELDISTNINILGTITYATSQTRYYNTDITDFVYRAGYNPDFDIRILYGSVTPGTTSAPVHLPEGATITAVNAFWWRDDAAATGSLDLISEALGDLSKTTMATVDSNSSAGRHIVEDTSINNATIANSSYLYYYNILIDANDSGTDCGIYGIVITYTITEP